MHADFAPEHPPRAVAIRWPIIGPSISSSGNRLFEARLHEMGDAGDCAYERALSRAYETLLRERRANSPNCKPEPPPNAAIRGHAGRREWSIMRGHYPETDCRPSGRRGCAVA